MDLREGVERGDSLTRTATASGLFPSLVLQMMGIGEETGSLDELLHEVAVYYESEVDYALKRLSEAIEPILEKPALANVALAGGIFLLAVALPLWLLLGTFYRIDDEHLRIRSGPFRWTIRLRDITSVRPSRSPISSPALSLDRLEITYGAGQRILVSPRDHGAFIAAIGQAHEPPADS